MIVKFAAIVGVLVLVTIVCAKSEGSLVCA